MKMEMSLALAEAPDQSLTVTVALPDFVACEEEFGQSIMDGLQQLPMSRMAWLAWHAQRRTGKTSQTYEDWLATIDDIDWDATGEPEEQAGEAPAG